MSTFLKNSANFNVYEKLQGLFQCALESIPAVENAKVYNMGNAVHVYIVPRSILDICDSRCSIVYIVHADYSFAFELSVYFSTPLMFIGYLYERGLIDQRSNIKDLLLTTSLCACSIEHFLERVSGVEHHCVKFGVHPCSESFMYQRFITSYGDEYLPHKTSLVPPCPLYAKRTSMPDVYIVYDRTQSKTFGHLYIKTLCESRELAGGAGGFIPIVAVYNSSVKKYQFIKLLDLHQ